MKTADATMVRRFLCWHARRKASSVPERYGVWQGNLAQYERFVRWAAEQEQNMAQASTDTRFPVESVIPQIERSLAANRSVVLRAPPGSGKTTCVAPALVTRTGSGVFAFLFQLRVRTAGR